MNFFPLILLSAFLLTIGPRDAESSSQVQLVQDWYSVPPTTTTTISDGDTATPVLEKIGHKSPGLIFSYFSPVRLKDGDRVNFSFELAIGSADTTSEEISFGELRFGLFQSSSPRASEAFGGQRTGREITVVEQWNGFLIFLPNTQSGDRPASIYRRKRGDQSNYAIKSGLDLRGSFSRATPVPRFLNNSEKRFALQLERQGGDLIVSISYDDETASSNLLGAFEGGYEATFDAFGFYASGEEIELDRVRFGNVNLTVESFE